MLLQRKSQDERRQARAHALIGNHAVLIFAGFPIDAQILARLIVSGNFRKSPASAIMLAIHGFVFEA